MIDALACEPQFLDHLAPVWTSLPHRGRFLVAPELLDRARAKGIVAESMDVRGLQQTPQKPPQHNGRPALIASIGDAKLGRRLGYGPFAFLEHGAGQTYGTGPAHASYAGGPDRADHELVMVPGPYSAEKWQRSYPAARVEIVGCPKLDTLPRKDRSDPPTIALSFHWPASAAISGFAGTALGEFISQLAKVAAAFQVIGHAHPKGDWPARMERHYKRAGIPFVADFEDVCRQADVYVCDNSSTIFEFAATGRPVLLLNSRYWKPPHGPGLRFWDAAEVGINVWPQDDLVAAITSALEDVPEQQRKRESALRLVYGVRRDGARKAARAITDWLTGHMAVAA